MKRTLLFLFLVCRGMLLHAQSPLVETISIEQGLSQGFVPAICQDDDGFMWFATKNGLNRYDGYQFQVFKHDPFDPFSLSSNEITGLISVGDFLVLTTPEGHLNLFHRKIQRFYNIILPHKLAVFVQFIPIGENDIGILFRHTTNGVYGEYTSLYLIRWPSDLSRQLERGADFEGFVKMELVANDSELISADLSADKKKIWLLTKDSIWVRDLISGGMQRLALPTSRTSNQWNLKSMGIIADMAGACWVYDGRKITRFDGRDREVFTLPFSISELAYADRKNGILWFLTGNELYGLDLKKMPFSPEPTWSMNLGQPLRSGFIDQSGNLWLGTDAHGIRKFSLRTTAFKNYLEGFSIYSQPVCVENRYVLMGDVRRNAFSIKILDLQRGQLIQPGNLGLPEQDKAYATTAGDGRFWMILHQSYDKLTWVEPATGRHESISFPADYSPGRFVLLRFTAPGEIWILSPRQITRFDIARRQFSFFNNPEKIDPEIFAAERSPDGTWWIGAIDGLYKAKPNGPDHFVFSKIIAEKGNRNSLRSNSIKSLLCDPADPNVLWIGTVGQGMSRLDIAKNQFTHYTTQNGLPDDVVYGILADDEKPRKLWISTNRGLARFSPETNSFQYFLKSDGLQDNEFNTFAASKLPSGKLLFGGVNGLTVFNPKDLNSSTAPPTVRLTSLRINGVVASPRDTNALLKKDIAFLERLELPYSQNSLVLQFAATDYTTPQRNQFAYYLEGAEAEWAHRGFEHTAQYLNLAPGTYTFRVKAANSSGVWNEQSISLIIVIHAPWYRTWWAYLIYAGLFAMPGYYFYTNQLQRKLEHAEAERLKGLDDFKNRFFTNITHEFRTPLTVILGASGQVEAKVGDDLKGPMKLIRRSGENLLRLINQILDLSKLESNTLKANYVQGDVLPYLRYIAESLHSLANAQNVMLRVESDQAKIVMDYDPERLLQIGYNLLSNAIKFTPGGGKVTIRAELTDAKMPGLRLTVTDTGAGIPAEDLPHIFDRFYQANNLQKAKAGGTGIGLALTKELVTLLGGEIAVISETGKGATFTVILPITQIAQIKRPPSPISWEDFTSSPPQIFKSSKLVAAERSPQILLIEDNPDVVEYLSTCLQNYYTLDFAFNGKAGIEKALETVPDLIISDVMMPEKDGFEVVEALKNDERSSHIPIVLLTAKADQTSRIAGLKKGADAYLAKPFHHEELLVTLSNLLEIRRKLQAKYAAITETGFQMEDDLSGQSAIRMPQPDLDPEDAFLQKIRTIIEKNLSDADFEMPQLERAVAMSRSQIFRKMKALTGKSPSQFIRSIRLHHGRLLLLTTELTVSEIAYEVGFANLKYFSDAFLEEFGERPSDVRK